MNKEHNRTVLVTGAAGFIGFHLARRLLAEGHSVVGFDNVNDYYDQRLKEARLGELEKAGGAFRFIKADLEDAKAVRSAFENHRPEIVVHLAAQAGVRYSISNPDAYINANLVGFHNVIDCCRFFPVEHFVYASSSSVYGASTDMPFHEQANLAHPLSLYAATKKANELMAHTYSHLFSLPTTGLRFFTVYGPWGRPDMALFKFTSSILRGTSIDVYNHGDMLRDFTYIDDIVEGICRTMDRIAAPNEGWSGDKPDPASSLAPYRVYNIGCSNPVGLMDMIRILERKLGRDAELNLMPLQPGDVCETFADVSALTRDTGFKPDTSLETGISRFVDWYLSFYGDGPV